MADEKQTWLVVHPASLLWALELVESGQKAEDVMLLALDLAKQSMEEDPDRE